MHNQALTRPNAGMTAGLFCLLLLVALMSLRGETIELNPAADTALRSTSANNNFGAAIDLPIGVAQGGSPRNRALIRFNLEGIPADATINSAGLRLFVTATSPNAATFGLHRALSDWGEGNKTTIIVGAPAGDGEATWNARFHPATLWGAEGGQSGTDYVAAASATAALGGGGTTATFSSAQMIEDIQAWLADPDANFGWFVIEVNESNSGTGRRIGSREHGSAAARPLLTIDYTVDEPPDPPREPSLFDLVLVGGEFRFSFVAEANRTYAVEFRESLTTGDWSPLSSFSEQPQETTLHVTNAVSSAEGYLRVRTPAP